MRQSFLFNLVFGFEIRNHFLNSLFVKFFVALLSIFFIYPVSIDAKKTTIFTIGDSTVSRWDSAHNYPKTGWGQVFKYFFNSDSVKIIDTAVSGASSKTFYNNFWASTRDSIHAGDFVFIQFGINDGNTNPEIATNPQTTFKDYLTKYVNETRARGAYPVLITPQIWNNPEKGTWGTFPEAIRQLAGALNVPLIDLDVMSKSLIESLGSYYSSNFIYMNFPSGDYSLYPNGSIDNTHFQKMGAIEMAKLVVKGIRILSSDQHIKELVPLLAPTYNVTFTCNNPALGIITRSGYFPEGITITAKALPYKWAKFDKWSGGISNTKAITSFVMGKAEMNIQANFSSYFHVVQAQ
jgi:lysophospholipase L1-like esterase